MWVKVCGITRRDDALRAAEYGADAVGFVFAPGSIRRVDTDVAAGIVGDLPPHVTTVGVFRDQAVGTVREVMKECGLDVAQLHGGEGSAFARELGLPVIKAIGLATEADLTVLGALHGCVSILLDAAEGGPLTRPVAGARPRGGSGCTVDWTLAARARARARIILAGGLTPENVAAAVHIVRPWGVDGASGTESSPGHKDPERLRSFIGAARRAVAALGAGPLPADLAGIGERER